jgi:hypothetical protein
LIKNGRLNWHDDHIGEVKLKIECFKNANSCWNTNISFNLETSGVQNSNRSLNVVHFFTGSVDLTSVAA